LSISPTHEVDAECLQKTASALSVSWEEKGAKRMIKFRFTATANVASLSQVDVEVDLDNATFPDANTRKLTHFIVINIHCCDLYRKCCCASYL